VKAGNQPATVLVTGAGRGIGRACVAQLARAGFGVIAGVRSEADARALADPSGSPISTVMLDVTRAEQIAQAADLVRATVGDRGLYGLVNNAGIVVAGPLEFLPLDALRQQLEVNLVGLLGITQALLPDLRRARGRIVNVSSVNGRVATPFSGAYAASKFALEAVSDALRRELDGAVDVVVIQPGAFRTDIWTTSRDRATALARSYPEAARHHYGGVLARLAEVRAPDRAGNPVSVARVVARALTTRRPRPRYVVGADARLGVLAAALLPARWLDALLRSRRRSRPADR
jgi:NAD(P)-dependent dehydrogenase (short-subunit alcohol dehydrogenase family)